ncbi:hypothetical protein Cwoe_0586 [Conexibacter woesei DSM 14684]|uniref:Uncharacterized protein n=1 Tax=Conexibacter woesei (strain DSM 14684 / CCUG 47730 / CIP 108061 / JCM 11494 / NBRC 100937 / ID131577) TaxID=469383 RepID=D3F8F1_CONWI|nr:hypothetical protein Cwoe_0586 [Conexibacter woesei DSM 14684]
MVCLFLLGRGDCTTTTPTRPAFAQRLRISRHFRNIGPAGTAPPVLWLGRLPVSVHDTGRHRAALAAGRPDRRPTTA